MNDGHVSPVGYCAGDFVFTGTNTLMPEPIFKKMVEDAAPFRHKYHTHGHASAEEAEACYKEYMLDRRLTFGTLEDTQRRCLICGEWTQRYAQVGGFGVYELCDLHCTRESMAVLYNVGVSAES